jgi:ubiquinone biosynthesis protein
VATLARHGFANVAERAQLGRFLIEKLSKSDHIERLSIPERLRISFEQLGPTFVKLGQLLATRPDLIPQEFVDEFKKLHDQVKPVPFEDIRSVLVAQYGDVSRALLT